MCLIAMTRFYRATHSEDLAKYGRVEVWHHRVVTMPRDDRGSTLRGFGAVGLLAMAAILAGNFVVAPLSAILVLAWARQSGTPMQALGFVRPGNWMISIVAGTTFGVAFKVLMKSVVMPLLGADPINQTYHYLVGNTAALPGILFSVVVAAGFGEETVFRGYLFERLSRLLGSGAWAMTAIVLVTSALFGIAHYADQGLPGVQQATIVGMVFGAVFAVTKSLWPLIVAHAAFDITAVFIIYRDLESYVAHLVFR